MKKLLLPSTLFLSILLMPFLASAQCIADQSSNTAGIYPSEILDNGCQNQSYADTVTLVFQIDTTVTVPPFGTFTIPFDSFLVSTILYLPSGLTWDCGSSNCTSYPAGPTSPPRECIEFSGTPTTTVTNQLVRIVITGYLTAPVVGVQSGNDTMDVYITINAGSSSNESDAVCSGESYTFPDGTTINNITSQVVHASTLTGVVTGCDSIITTTVDVNPSYDINLSDSVCEGESYTFPDGHVINNISAPVIYSSSLQTVITGCDSIITIAVDPIFPYTATESVSVCSGGSYTFPDGTTENNIVLPVGHISLLTSVVTNCDSIITTNVSVDPVYNINLSDAVCDGGSYTFPDGTTINNIGAPVVYASTLQSVVTGCDSVITIAVDPVFEYNGTASGSVCSGGSYTFPDGTTQTNITSQVVYTSNLQTVALGCDSNITTTVDIITSYNISESDAVCEGYSYTFPDGTTQNNITSQTVHVSMLTSVIGSCDSIITTTVNVTSLPDTSVNVSGATLTANNSSANYQWVDCNNSFAWISGETAQSYVASDGSYAVIITENGCSDTSLCHTIMTVGLNDKDEEYSVSVFPNPTADGLTITTGKVFKELTISLQNIAGQLVSTKTVYNTAKEFINVGEAKGIYFLRVQSPEGLNKVIRVVKE